MRVCAQGFADGELSLGNSRKKAHRIASAMLPEAVVL